MNLDVTKIQSAVLGHVITDRHFFERCQMWGVQKGWFNDERYQRVYGATVEFAAKYHRHPTATEALAKAGDGLTTSDRDGISTRLDQAVAASREVGQDLLHDELKSWAIQVKYQESTTSLMRAYEAEEWPQVSSGTRELAAALTRIEEVGDTTNRFLDAPTRIDNALANKKRLADKVLPFGITVLDDAMDGILPNDLVIIGAKSGKGKTELCTSMAKFIARTPRRDGAGQPLKVGDKVQTCRVAFFALEANENEIELRATYPILANLFLKDHPHDGRKISFNGWVKGKLEKELGPYEADAVKKFKEQHSSLRTFYKIRGDFTLDNLEQKIHDIRKDTDIIFIDHLGFVDAKPGTNLYESQAKITQTLRDLARDYEIPVVLVVHLKKLDRGKGAPLVPDQEDFSGSAGIFQVANVVILMSPGSRLLTRRVKDPKNEGQWILQPFDPSSRLKDTFFCLRKARMLGGDVTDATMIARYDTSTNSYDTRYAVGYLTDNDSQWEPARVLPAWAEKNGYTDLVLPTKQQKG